MFTLVHFSYHPNPQNQKQKKKESSVAVQVKKRTIFLFPWFPLKLYHIVYGKMSLHSDWKLTAFTVESLKLHRIAHLMPYFTFTVCVKFTCSCILFVVFFCFLFFWNLKLLNFFPKIFFNICHKCRSHRIPVFLPNHPS